MGDHWMIFSIFHCIKSHNFAFFFACLSLLLLWLGLFNIIRYKYLYSLTQLCTVHVLRHPNEHSAQTQLVVVVAMPTTHAHKTKTLKNIKQNMKNTENVFRNGKNKKNKKKQKRHKRQKFKQCNKKYKKTCQSSRIYLHFVLILKLGKWHSFLPPKKFIATLGPTWNST